MANVTTRSAPLSRATSAVLSVDPSSMTRTATLEKPGIVRGSAASARGRVSSSFNAGIWITSFIGVAPPSPDYSWTPGRNTGRCLSSREIYTHRWGVLPTTPCPRQRFFVEARKRDDGDVGGIVEER